MKILNFPRQLYKTMSDVTDNTFLYFAYGSNLLTQRIHENNRTATRAGIAKLPNYRLDFNLHSPRWHGASATIVPTPSAHLWGALWRLDIGDMRHLDEQECGGEERSYYALDVDVTLSDGTMKRCRSYRHVAETPYVENVRDLPEERRPSAVYLRVIKEGAKESKLPMEYLEWLNGIPDNGYCGKVNVNVEFNFDTKTT